MSQKQKDWTAVLIKKGNMSIFHRQTNEPAPWNQPLTEVSELHIKAPTAVEALEQDKARLAQEGKVAIHGAVIAGEAVMHPDYDVNPDSVANHPSSLPEQSNQDVA